MWNNTEQRYSTMLIALHWLMLLLLAAVYACIELNDLFPKGSAARDGLKSWHFMLGLSVLLLVGLRLLLRVVAGRPPSIRPSPPQWQERLARLIQTLLYALMIGMPLAGWMALSAAGKPVPFFGWEWPPLLGPDKALASQIKELHEFVGNAGYWLIGLHTLAALFHHYWRRDNTLALMIPALRSRPDRSD
ncbi:MAG: cytochrome b/b6 domain-containing protein [Burkholderiaceae bacterium]